MLAKRRAKKDKLKDKMGVLAEKKQLEDDHYNKKLDDIAKMAKLDKDQVEIELKKWRNGEEKDLESELAEMRANKLSAQEKAMEDFKKRKMNAENEYEFADMLTKYGEKVKAVDEEMARARKEKEAELEEKLKLRRQKKKQEIDDRKA